MTTTEFPDTLYRAPSEWGDCGYPTLLTEEEAEAAAEECTETFEKECSIDECTEYNLIRAISADKSLYYGDWHSDSCQRNRRRRVCVIDSSNKETSAHETIADAVDYEIPAPSTLEELMERMQANACWNDAPVKQGGLDWSSLPTFGGDDPIDTAGIWSWDADSFLIGENADSLQIIDREDWESEAI